MSGIGGARGRRARALFALAVALLATGALPLLHLSTHGDDHVHTPGGTIELVRAEDDPGSAWSRLSPPLPDHRHLADDAGAVPPAAGKEPPQPPARHGHGSPRHRHVPGHAVPPEPRPTQGGPPPAPAPPAVDRRAHGHAHRHDGAPAPRHGDAPGSSRSAPHRHHGPGPGHGDGSLAHFAAFLDPVLPGIALPDRAAPAVEAPRFLSVAVGVSSPVSRARSRGPPEG